MKWKNMFENDRIIWVNWIQEKNGIGSYDNPFNNTIDAFAAIEPGEEVMIIVEIPPTEEDSK